MSNVHETTLDIVEVADQNTSEKREPRILEDLTQDMETSKLAYQEQLRLQYEAEQEALDDAEIDAQIEAKNSVVDPKFKLRYKLLAQQRGHKGKAAKRSNWDWLAQQMAELCLDKKSKLRVSEFYDLMAANAVDCDRWPNRSPGWEGRLRMTACLVLRKEMAERADGILQLADGTIRTMPAEDLAALIKKYEI